MISPGGQEEMHSRLSDRITRRDRLITGSVRNPWDWYVSLWGYGCDGSGVLHNKLTGVRRVTGHGFNRSFSDGMHDLLCDLKRSRTFWKKVYSDSSSPVLFRRWLSALLDSPKQQDMRKEFNRSSLSGFAGFYTYRYCYLYHDTDSHLFDGSIETPRELIEADRRHNVVDHIIRMENITDGIIEMLIKSGTSSDSGLFDRIRSMSRTNPSSRKADFSSYYDSKTRDLVGQKDALIVDKYAYDPPEIRES